MSIQADVIISGAGPVGLYFALQMALRGHAVFCVDPKPGPTDQSRAILVSSRTMEIFGSVGIAEEILYESYVASGIRIHRDETKVLNVPFFVTNKLKLTYAFHLDQLAECCRYFYVLTFNFTTSGKS
jgi:2-polyprenyl-6-methoxyphenol hydroxylase-like FAD-dependent oxidoreductase